MKKAFVLVGLAFCLIFFAGCTTSSNGSKTGTSASSGPVFEITSGVKNGKAVLDSDHYMNVGGTAPAGAKYVAFVMDDSILDVVKVTNGKFHLRTNGAGGPYHLKLYASKSKIGIGGDVNKLKGKSIALNVPSSTSTVLTSDQGSSEESSSEESSEEESSSESSAAESSSFNPSDYQPGASFDQLARTPDDYKGKKVSFTGNVIQVVEGDDETDLRVAIDGDIDNIILVGFNPEIMNGSRVLEDDKITFYGMSLGTTTYDSTAGGKITVPLVYAAKIDDSGKAPDSYGY